MPHAPALPPNACDRLAPVLSLVGDKWTILVVLSLGDGPKRFSQLRALIPSVSPRMLTRTVRGLEENGFVHRKVEAVIPPKVEYSLTALGLSLCEPINALGAWTWSHIGEIEAARRDYQTKQVPDEARD